MCLTINPKEHVFWFNHYIPKVAKRDILVFKRLLLQTNGQYITSYRAHPVNFVNGRTVLKATIEVEKSRWSVATKWHRDRIIGPGIHSYRSMRYYFNYAIIPEGTTFYVGRNNDIVSEKLIIFQHLNDYTEYCAEKQITPRQYRQFD